MTRVLIRTCTDHFNVTLGSNAICIKTSSVDVVLLSTGQTGDLTGGAAGVTGPPLTLCVFSHGHVREGALRGLP